MAAPDNLNPEEALGFRPEGPAPSPDVRTGYRPPDISDTLKQRHAETANKLAAWLIAILGGSLVIHYACIMILILYKRDDAAKLLEDLFHSWLPVLSGLAGAAVTYYFTKSEK